MSVKIATVTLNPAVDQTVSISNYRLGRVNRAQRVQTDPGGRGVNVASFLADYGLAVAATGFLGRENPYLFEQMFAKKHIEDHFVRIAGSTRTGIKIIDDVKQETTDINFPGQPPTESDIETLFTAIDKLAGRYDWFVLSGSVPAGTTPDIYAKLVEIIKAHGKQVALDSSGEAFRQALPAVPTMVKPNLEALEEYLGYALADEDAAARAARQLVDEGIQTVVVSMGERGAVFVDETAVVLAIPPDIEVKSRVGAGDAMVAGLIAGQVLGLELQECARLATAFSMAAISQLGTHLPDSDTLQAYRDQVDIRELDVSDVSDTKNA